MRSGWTRVRAHTGLWCLVALLGLGTVFVATAAEPAVTRVEDQALRQQVAQAPSSARDITIGWPRPGFVDTAGQARDTAQDLLPQPLGDRLATAWGSQATDLTQGSLAGAGVTTSHGWLPAAELLHLTGLPAEITMVEGVEPAPDPDAGAVEVMVSTGIAEALGLRVGQDYDLISAAVSSGVSPNVAQEAPDRLALRLTGVFAPADESAPIWESQRRLLRPGSTVVEGSPPTNTHTAALATDQAGIDALTARDLLEPFGLRSTGRLRLDATSLDAAWTGPAEAAVAELRTSPGTTGLTVETGLAELIGEFRTLAAANRAVSAVVAAGIIGTGAGLLLLAGALAVSRREAELSLLRSRGGSVATLLRRLTAEAALVVAPAALLGWLLHLLVTGEPGEPGAGWLPGTVALVAVLVVPVTAALRHRRVTGAARTDLARVRPAPARLTLELCLLLLAGLGVLVLNQRGLALAGTDPYLSAVPVLVAMAAGLVALRLYPWPLRAFGALAAGRRGAVGFLGLARAGRAAPATALPLLVLVLAVAVGGFAGGVHGSVQDARDDAAVAEVGAHARIAADGLTPAAADAAAAVPGVAAVVPSGLAGDVFLRGAPVADPLVIAVDPAAYQENLAALGVSARLPEAMLAAGADTDPVPVLGVPRLAGLADLTLHTGEVQLPVSVVGDVSDLPGREGGRRVVLVSRAALPEAPPIDELLVAGAGADLTTVRDAVASEIGTDPEAVTVTSLAEHRSELEGFGFNAGLTQAFVTGVVVAALGGLLAVGLALVAGAAARGRAVSLLRALGLSTRQARALLLVELLPLAAVAIAVGTAVGVALPAMLQPALGLSSFTGGADVPIGLDPTTVGLLAALVGALLVAGTALETRRPTPG